MNEKSVLESVDHPFVVKLAGTFQGLCALTPCPRILCIAMLTDAGRPVDGKFLSFVLEFVVGGEFFMHLRKAGRFDNNTAKFYAAQIVTVFDYLHSQDIIYRDLKPENLLLDQEGYLKITGG